MHFHRQYQPSRVVLTSRCPMHVLVRVVIVNLYRINRVDVILDAIMTTRITIFNAIIHHYYCDNNKKDPDWLIDNYFSRIKFR